MPETPNNSPKKNVYANYSITKITNSDTLALHHLQWVLVNGINKTSSQTTVAEQGNGTDYSILHQQQDRKPFLKMGSSLKHKEDSN